MCGREIWINFDAHQILTTHYKHREKYVFDLKLFLKLLAEADPNFFSRLLVPGPPRQGRQVLKVWSLPRFWFSIPSYRKQLVRILDLAWLKFDVAALRTMYLCSKKEFFNSYLFEEQGTFESSE